MFSLLCGEGVLHNATLSQLGEVLYLWYKLVILHSSFVEEDGHGVFYGNGIDVFEGISDGWHR